MSDEIAGQAVGLMLQGSVESNPGLSEDQRKARLALARAFSEGQDAHLPSGNTTISHECDLHIEMHPAIERDDACLGIFPAEACDVRRDFF